MNFGQLLEKQRKLKYKSSRAFYDKETPPCSYYHYCNIERGVLPEIKLAIALIKLLEINMKVGLDTWMYSLLPTTESKVLYQNLDFSELPATSPDQDPSKILVINRMQASFIKANSEVYEILCYIHLFQNEKGISQGEIEEKFKNLSNIRELLDTMYEHCLVEKNTDGCFFTKEHFTFPEQDSLEHIQEMIFAKNISYFQKSNGPKSRCTLLTNLSPEQIILVKEKMKAFRDWVCSLPKVSIESGARPYSLGMFSLERNFDNV